MNVAALVLLHALLNEMIAYQQVCLAPQHCIYLKQHTSTPSQHMCLLPTPIHNMSITTFDPRLSRTLLGIPQEGSCPTSAPPSSSANQVCARRWSSRRPSAGNFTSSTNFGSRECCCDSATTSSWRLLSGCIGKVHFPNFISAS